ncbi:hypothetical protein JVX93_04420 [Mycolicibacterium boenickei]|nr:hypothetical protein JVX93_04420 [Mycolicibacterium boenickei]
MVSPSSASGSGSLFGAEEDAFIRAHYPTAEKERIIAELGRTWKSIQARASRLGVKRTQYGAVDRRRRSFTANDDAFLVEHYATSPSDHICQQLEREWSNIQHRARKLGLSRARTAPDAYTLASGVVRRAYTAEDEAFLLEHYLRAPKEEICKQLGRQWKSIVEHASKMGLNRPKIRSYKLSRLLDDSPLNAYWWGFILADGYLGEKGSLVVALSTRDREHLEKLGSYLGAPSIAYERNGEMSRLAVSDKYGCAELRKKLMLSTEGAKTYFPPTSLEFLDADDLVLPFFIGLVDGDGSIHYDHNGTFKSIRILVHGSWHETLVDLASRVSAQVGRTPSVSNTNARGNASLYLGTVAAHQILKQNISVNQLPALRRKWESKGSAV